MPLRLPRSLLLLVLLPLTACGHTGESPAVTVRDSAGITIITHSGAALDSAPVWTATPATLTVGGGDDPNESFSYISGAARLADNEVLVLDSENEAVRVLLYESDGRFARQVGRVGMGPGEFQFPFLLGARGDTLTIYDARNSRVTVLTTRGQVLATRELARLGPSALGVPAGALDDGRIVSAPLSFRDTVGDGRPHFRQVTPIVLADPARATLDTLTLSIPGTESFRMMVNFGRISMTSAAPVGYGRHTLLGVRSDQVVVAANVTSDLVSYRLPWAPTRIVRFGHRHPPVDAAARQAMVDRALANVERFGNQMGAMRDAAIDNIRRGEFADSMADWSAMTVGQDGSIWLREMRSAADSVPHLIVLASDGRSIAHIDLPEGARLLWTDGDRVLIALQDENEVPRLELRPISKAPASP